MFLPQQLPGPAQPACSGLAPQQPAWAGVEVLTSLTPERDDGTESIFCRSLLPQDEHFGSALDPDTSSSICSPQALHENSKIGMVFLAVKMVQTHNQDMDSIAPDDPVASSTVFI